MPIKIYYEVDTSDGFHFVALEDCKYRSDGIRVGSQACKECPDNIEYKMDWIICGKG